MTDIQEKTNKTEKTILLIGASGSGKSTLGNVLIGRDDNSEVFAEGHFSYSETQEIQCERKVIDGVEYKIIDSPGFLDTTFEIIKIHPALGELNKHAQLGIDYVLFTIEKFHMENVVFFQHLKEFFSGNVVNYTTIVFTEFQGFDNETSCKKNLEGWKNRNKSIADILNNVKTVHVDNTPLSKEKNEAVLIEKEKYYEVTSDQIEGIRKFIEWRKNIEKGINDHMKNLRSGIEFCEVVFKIVTGRGASLSFLVSESSAPPGSEDLNISIENFMFKLITALFEYIINEIYFKKISVEIKKDIEKRSDFLTEKLSKRIKYDDSYVNKLKEELRSSFFQFDNEIEAILGGFRETVVAGSNFTTDVANDPGIKKMKSRAIRLIDDAKKSHIDKSQEDYSLLEEEQNRLRKSHEKLDNEIKEIKRKLEEEYNKIFFV
ncbi:hypothetical protein RhiirA4_513840 [Rhizophagus irregularis]|uniref:AIG1-type G domain-containing protein n=1 Tax=Rhizophagus irregularis TaxID=588596 RepID=A0A2I1HJ41_9GLOM|nr:hypothetical protein RhiirA4_513840 [Rhizophagus irregularis]